MKKVVSLALLAGGSRLTMFGVTSYATANCDSSGDLPCVHVSRAKWVLIGGVVVTVIGLVGLLRPSNVT